LARKKKEVKTTEQLKQENLERELESLKERLHLITVPTNMLKVGDKVTIGSLADVFIEEVLEDGKIYLINYTKTDNNYGNPISHKNQKRYVKWTDVRLKNNNAEILIQNDDLRLSYHSGRMGEIFSKAYYFGIDFEPDYQRDYVWELQDKVELIDSIFNNVDIGKFVFIRIDDRKWEESGYKYGYEILDGKQRIRAILDYYEDRFTYKGKLFSELSIRDQDFFEDYHINIAELDKVTEEQALKYFIKLNITGKTMDKSHLDKVRERLNGLK
jgi:hypothetical protein